MQGGHRPVVNAMDLPRAALGWLLFAVAFWAVGPYFNYSPAGFLDPWIPIGYFLNFEDLVSRYGFPYYVSRIPFILTGLAAYSIFSPHVANFILHSFYLWLACLGLYCAAAEPFGKPAATIATLAFAFSTYTATSMAWDYPNGAAIAFLLLGLWLALSPPPAISYRVRWIAVGVLWTIAGTNNLLSLLVVFPWFLMVLYLSELSFIEGAKRSFLIFSGAGLMILAFGIVSKLLFDIFWFLGPQIELILYATTTPDYLSNMWGKGYGWVSTAFRDAALLGICIAGLAALAVTARDPKISGRNTAAASVGAFLLTLCVFAFVEFVLNGVVLRVPYTSVYLVAPAYLALAGGLSLLLRNLSDLSRHLVLAISAVVLIAIPFAARPISFWSENFPLSTWLLPIVPAVLILAIRVLPGGTFRQLVMVTAVIALAALPAVATTADKRLGWVFRPSEPTFDAALKVSNILRSGPAKGRTVRFWFDHDEALAPAFRSIGSLYLYEWQGLRNFPDWSDREVRENLPENTVLVHLTANPDKVDGRESQMKARGIKFGARRSIPIRTSGGMEFFLILQDAHGHSAAPAGQI